MKSLIPWRTVASQRGLWTAWACHDSWGDFNFCTEFKDTKEVLVINRTRTDDAALCAGIAAYQKKHGIDLAAANKNGDSLFLIQGRNENKGEFWNDFTPGRQASIKVKRTSA